MAQRFKVSVAPDVERFFQAAAAGRWEELNADFEALKQRRESGNGEDLGVLWGPILETLLIAECGHNWPAQKLLDYGDATLGALRPGMVYVGGTDPGRGIPTLLNETSDAERHIVITQNALADGSYLQMGYAVDDSTPNWLGGGGASGLPPTMSRYGDGSTCTAC